MSVKLNSVFCIIFIYLIQFVLSGLVINHYGVCKDPNSKYGTYICCDGFKKNNTIPLILECGPICTPECSNGYCSDPGVCKCDPGYLSDPSNPRHCIPDCGGECDNGVCTAPMTCTCNHGYNLIATPFGSMICEPVCTEPCHNGVCVQPEKCHCNSGYMPRRYSRKSKTSTCEPICSPSCYNGVCVGPNTCRCNDGYQGFGDFSTCLPITTTEPTMMSTTPSTEYTETTGNTDYEAHSEILTNVPSIGETSATDAPKDNQVQYTWIIIVCVVLLTAFVLMIMMMIYKRRSLNCIKKSNYTFEAPQSNPTTEDVEFNVKFSST